MSISLNMCANIAMEYLPNVGHILLILTWTIGQAQNVCQHIKLVYKKYFARKRIIGYEKAYLVKKA